MELFSSYLAVIRDSTVPANRVVRNTAVICVVLVISLFYYRHSVLGFSFGEPALVTAALAFMLFGAIGVFGGLLAGAAYAAFRKSVGAQSKAPTASVLFAEWLFAAAAPLIGALAFGVVSSHQS